MATIYIDNLKAYAIIGTQEWERETPQELILSLAVEYDSSKASRSDDLNDALDYCKLTDRVILKVENSQFYLLEKLADHILDDVMEEKLVQKVQLRITKPAALGQKGVITVEVSGKR
jgi:dihydroneopterin aldolase